MMKDMSCKNECLVEKKREMWPARVRDQNSWALNKQTRRTTCKLDTCLAHNGVGGTKRTLHEHHGQT